MLFAFCRQIGLPIGLPMYELTFCQIELKVVFIAYAQSVILQSSAEREPTLTAGMTMYVSSAYLQSSLPSVTRCRSDAFKHKMLDQLLSP